MLRHFSSGSASPISTKLWGGGRGRGRRARVLWAGKPKLAAHDDALRAHVMNKPDTTLAELQAWLIAEHDTKVSAGCRLRHLGLTLKKSHCAPLNKTTPISPKPARSGALNPERLVFLDETGAKTN